MGNLRYVKVLYKTHTCFTVYSAEDSEAASCPACGIYKHCVCRGVR